MIFIRCGVFSQWKGIVLSLMAAGLPMSLTLPARGEESVTLRVMTLNLWHGGDAGKQPLERTAEVIRQARADVVGLQETDGIAPKGNPLY